MHHASNHKITSIEQAVSKYVSNGAHLSIGGFTINRNPMAAVHEIIRQGIRNLHVYAHSNGQGLDQLIGAGCVSRLEIAYSGNGRFAPTCLCFKRAVLERTIQVEDYTNFQMALRFLAGAMGVPFLPTYSSLGTDIVEKWGFPDQIRLDEPKLASKKLVVMDNPFSRDHETEKLVLVPAIHPDVTIIHAQKADATGCTRIEGLSFADIDQAKAARHVIVTCDHLVSENELRKDSGANHLPAFCVDAVVHIPHGAYPTACFNEYDYDAVFLEQYQQAAGKDDTLDPFFQAYIHSPADHAEFVAMAAQNRLESIRANPVTGYADRMKRGA